MCLFDFSTLPPPKKIKEPSNELLEADVEKAVCNYAKRKGCYVRKFVSTAHRSVPDRLFITPAGRVFFVEFKRPKKAPTPAQYKELAEIEAHNGNAFWTDSIEVGKGIVDSQLQFTPGTHSLGSRPDRL